MKAKSLLCCWVLSSASFLMVYTHMLMEERITPNYSSSSLQVKTQSDVPPILIVELAKTVRRETKDETRSRKNKFSARRKRPPPPANCIPLWGSCKTPNTVCCEHCAFCQCRLFKTVCYCRIGNPRC